ncbi:ArsR/SmtB family transcription factor [Rhodoblastus sp.]|uniref:ArsR/SmtB family transcription factor n=1 Tax=Rhodoblastus sp. TaxID=1962975 RepID=UPI003F9A88CC
MALPKLENMTVSEGLGQIADNARDASEFLKALAHEYRLLILCILSEGEKSVGDLETLLAQRQSTVSQQLARLRLDGLVTARRDGKSIYYNLADDDVRTILRALHSVFCNKPGRRRRAGGKSD